MAGAEGRKILKFDLSTLLEITVSDSLEDLFYFKQCHCIKVVAVNLGLT